MDISFLVFFIGILIILGHILSEVFTRTKIPDLLFLLIIGLVLGPVFGLVTTEMFGILGPIFSTISLIVILFEGGLNLRIEAIRSTFKECSHLTLLNFCGAIGIATLVVLVLAGTDPLTALMLAIIVAGTSPSVVIPLIRQLGLTEKSQTILSIESALTDVLSIVLLLIALQAYQLHKFSFWQASETLVGSFVVAILVGIAGGIAWSVIRKKFAFFNRIFAIPAIIFILYGFIEMIGFSGAVAALVFGITIGNLGYFKGIFSPVFELDVRKIELTETEKAFFGEIVFLLRTFFFIYIGLSIQFNNREIFILGLLVTLLLYLVRIPAVLFSIPRSTPVWDASVMAVMIPKGLATAVLASIPLQQAYPEGMFIQNATYAIVLFSIIINSLLIILLDKTAFSRIYRRIFSKFKNPSESVNSRNMST
ncbi:MAG: cation:proton antiporter [Methanoregula sp.]|jgi:NhaP-type Na+/H+ or K+/H+ antiporter|uniref:cation:proton antiporter n=1 Tax=Methanoregula sp. TaxID=2052170 RepID=UPI0025E4C183|nr:cation:proton antiporter [Methanoregula sp.]MCK9630078.1 cation:proton antiporter [Methanoregula sp.]